MMTLFVTFYNFDKVILANRVRVDVDTTEALKKSIEDMKVHLSETYSTHPEFIKTIIEI